MFNWYKSIQHWFWSMSSLFSRVMAGVPVAPGRRWLSSSHHHRISVTDLGDGIKAVELNRPEKMNSLDNDMFKAICHTATELKQDKSVRAVILSGKGKAFCTGLDIKSVNFESRKLLDRPAGTEISNMAQDVAYLWRQLDVPVIAVLHGMCFGGGLQIALGADFRITTPDCKLCIMEAKWVSEFRCCAVSIFMLLMFVS